MQSYTNQYFLWHHNSVSPGFQDMSEKFAEPLFVIFPPAPKQCYIWWTCVRIATRAATLA
jgi:hypothetical protein